MQIKIITRLNNDCKKSVNKVKNILVIGVFHGDEPVGEFLIEEHLKKSYAGVKNNVFYIPRLNSENTRVNKNGVDLNRNFPTKNWILSKKDEYYGGTEPGCEDETKFVVKLMNDVKFDAVVTLHTPYKIINFDPCESKEAKELAKTISKFTGYPVESDIGYPTPGSFGTYSGVERNIPTITIEADEEINPYELLPNFEKVFFYLENIF